MVSVALPNTQHPAPNTYAAALQALNAAGVPYVVGGAWAAQQYAALGRAPADLDLMLSPEDLGRVIEILQEAGWSVVEQAEAQVRLVRESAAIDLVHHFAHGFYAVDRSWQDRGVPARLGGTQTSIASPEDLIWTKAFVAARHRFDGADIVHLIRATHQTLDWTRLVERFRPFPHLLLAYLNLFEFCYPAEGDAIPDVVWDALLDAAARPPDPASPNACYGTLLDHASYEFDVVAKGYQQARPLALSS